MDRDYSFQGLMDFLEYAGEHGLINAGTAQGYRVAASKIEDVLTDQERKDVRGVDVAAVFQRFVNRSKVAVAPRTLRTYQQRLTTAVEEFSDWREDPTSYKPRGRSPAARKASDGKASQKKRTASESAPARESRPEEKGRSVDVLNLSFPLRADFLAHVQVPRDLTSAEAGRLGAFIRTLALDFEPS